MCLKYSILSLFLIRLFPIHSEAPPIPLEDQEQQPHQAQRAQIEPMEEGVAEKSVFDAVWNELMLLRCMLSA